MAHTLAKTSLNGSVVDILNTIRANASYEYQNLVPEAVDNDIRSIPAVGEVIYGNPTLQNEFINALVNRIALVVVNSAVFNNPYRDLKKGFLDFGESIEDVFVDIIKAMPYSAEKAEAREFKRYMPNVRSAFHLINWEVLYPLTIEKENLRKAFLSGDGVESMIMQIVESIYTSASYDEFLLFKYLIIKACTQGKIYPVAIDATDMELVASTLRETSNTFTFMSTKYNNAGVHTTTPKERQVVFMDSAFNAKFDVEVLARAFNMDKADFMGRLHLIDDFTTFDNDRFSVIRAESDGLEEVTSTELTLMTNVKAIILDEKWFQVYDALAEMQDQRLASGLYWNYFYHTWKVISSSPFANAVAIFDDAVTVTPPSSVVFTVDTVEKSSESYIITLKETGSVRGNNTAYEFLQDAFVSDGIAVFKEGGFIVPIAIDNGSEVDTYFTPAMKIGTATYTASAAIHTLGVAASGNDPAIPAVAVGDTVTMSKDV